MSNLWLMPFLINFVLELMTKISPYTFREDHPTLSNTEAVVWPLCYVAPFLFRAGLHEWDSLVTYANSAVNLPSHRNGLGWEYVAWVAIAIVMYCASFRELTDAERKVVGHVPSSHPAVPIVALPESIDSVQKAQTYLRTEPRVAGTHTPTLFFAYFKCGRFRGYDALSFFFDPKGEPPIQSWRGFQMKLANDYPDFDAPDDVPGVLFRGSPPKTTKSAPAKRQGWTYLTLDFLPYSLRHLLPSEWDSDPGSEVEEDGEQKEKKTAQK